MPNHIGFIIIEHDMDVALRVVESVTGASLFEDAAVVQHGVGLDLLDEVQQLYLGGGHG